MKEYVVVKFTAGAKANTYAIWPDYGDMAWGSPIYEVVGYYPSYRKAVETVKKMKAS